VTDIVNMAISNKFLYGLMKIGAKRQLKSTAEARGIAWDGNIAELQGQMQVYRIGVFAPPVPHSESVLKSVHALYW
jgi:hypothetical protein